MQEKLHSPKATANSFRQPEHIRIRTTKPIGRNTRKRRATMKQEARKIVSDLIEKQQMLHEAFFAIFPEADELLQQVPWVGAISAGGSNWQYRKHGLGILFTEESTGIRIDFADNLHLCDAVIASRLAVYIQSLGIQSVTSGYSEFLIDDCGTRELFAHLVRIGWLAPLPFAPDMATLAARYPAPQ